VLVNTLLALPVYAAVKRLLQPVLPEDPRRRRRRAYTTGGLSPLQAGSSRVRPIPRTSR
jgi:rod shape-determining protein MreD